MPARKPITVTVLDYRGETDGLRHGRVQLHGFKTFVSREFLWDRLTGTVRLSTVHDGFPVYDTRAWLQRRVRRALEQKEPAPCR